MKHIDFKMTIFLNQVSYNIYNKCFSWIIWLTYYGYIRAMLPLGILRNDYLRTGHSNTELVIHCCEEFNTIPNGAQFVSFKMLNHSNIPDSCNISHHNLFT